MSDTDAPANEERLRAAIGPRADYYLRHWREMDEKGKKTSWNWAACFANFYWFLYRKMWLATLVFVLANIVVGVLGAPLPPRYGLLAAIGLTFVTGYYGNYLYRRQIGKLVASPATLEQLRARGGISWPALAVALALSAAGAAWFVVTVVPQIQAQQRAAGLRSP